MNPFVDDLQSRAVDAQNTTPWYFEGDMMILIGACLALLLAATFALALKD